MTIQSMTVTDAKDATTKKCCQGPFKLRTKLFITLLLVLVVVAGVAGYFIGVGQNKKTGFSLTIDRSDPIDELPPSESWAHRFQRAAVCTDAPYCSEVGREILSKNGSAVDAAIAAMFCNSLLNHQSMGLGGGFFMTVYIKDEKKAYSVIAREKAPAAATENMFEGNSKKSSMGGMAVGVPGELRGLWAAYKRWGKAPWESLIAPTLQLCSTGFPISKALYDGVLSVPDRVKNDTKLRKMYFDEKKNDFYKEGTIVKPREEFCNTLQQIAEKGGDELYNGSLANVFLDDLKAVGSIITAEDLINYQAKITDPIAVPLSDGDILYTPPPPSSGVILVNILNILSGYNFSASSIKGIDATVLTYHRIIEAFKYAYATRTKLGDVDFLDLKDLIKKVTTPEYGAEIRSKINDTATSNNASTYGADEYMKSDNGTAHISILAENGDAVTVTSSINMYFGAGFTTHKTGIVMNNVMDDFSSPGIINYFGVKPSPANFISPGKRPMSSMAPSIIVDRTGDAKLVIGSSGGTKITTALALVIMRKLWFGQTVKQAVDAARIHHQLYPMVVSYEYGTTQAIIKGLVGKGHELKRYTGRGSVVCALYKNGTTIYANADFRKGGDVAGIN